MICRLRDRVAQHQRATSALDDERPALAAQAPLNGSCLAASSGAEVSKPAQRLQLSRGQALREADSHEHVALRLARQLGEHGPATQLQLLQVAGAHALRASRLREVAGGMA